jgi:protein TonB
MVVLVDTNGRAKSATVLSDPGFGFGRAARSCAMGKQSSVAKNKSGSPVAQTTPPFVIKFTR